MSYRMVLPLGSCVGGKGVNWSVRLFESTFMFVVPLTRCTCCVFGIRNVPIPVG